MRSNRHAQCRTYLRHQIRQYLYRHADMPPKAIVLVALLIPETASDSQDSCSSQETSIRQDFIEPC